MSFYPTPTPITPSIRTLNENSQPTLWAAKYARAFQPIPYETIKNALTKYLTEHSTTILLEGPYLTKYGYINCKVLTKTYGPRYIKLDPVYLNFVLA